MKRWRRLALIVAVIIGSWLVWQTIHAGDDVPLTHGGGSGSALVRLNGGTAGGKRLDGKSWSLDYANANFSQDGTTAELDDIHDGVIFRNGKPYVRMHARHVSANLATNDFTVIGGVTFDEIDGRKRHLETSTARYIGNIHTVYLDQPTTITEGSAHLRVATLQMNFTTGDTVLGRVMAVF
jgi:hypothetical protein